MGGAYHRHKKAYSDTEQYGENGYLYRSPQTSCYVLPPVVLYEIEVEPVLKVFYPISHFHILSVNIIFYKNSVKAAEQRTFTPFIFTQR